MNKKITGIFPACILAMLIFAQCNQKNDNQRESIPTTKETLLWIEIDSVGGSAEDGIEFGSALKRTISVLKERIRLFGIEKFTLDTTGMANQILIRIIGRPDTARLKALLAAPARLEFWETISYGDICTYFFDANNILPDKIDLETYIQSQPPGDTLYGEMKENAMQSPLHAYLQPNLYQNDDGNWYSAHTATVGYSRVSDTAKVNFLLSKVRDVFPVNLKLVWRIKHDQLKNLYPLIALKNDYPPLVNNIHIESAKQDYTNNNEPAVFLKMNDEGTELWRRLTAANISKQIAIVFDGKVYSCPHVHAEIPSGRSIISGGNMSIEEAQDLANVINSGSLPLTVKIIKIEITDQAGK